MEVRRFHKPRWVDICDECSGDECVCGKQEALASGCECSQSRHEFMALLKELGVDTPERFKGIFQQEHKPCGSCTKYVYDQLKKQKAKRSLARPRPGRSGQRDSKPDVSTADRGIEPIENAAWARERMSLKSKMKPIGSEAAVVQKKWNASDWEINPKKWKPKILNGFVHLESEETVLESKKMVVKLQLEHATPYPMSNQGPKAYSHQLQWGFHSDNAPHSTIVNPRYPVLPAFLTHCPTPFSPFFYPGFPPVLCRLSRI
mmetsp:Transcript_48419/g.88734  ORF Transcript_48419/g.88734 Transcript_48419/m.88734 type:complete len:260 (-) Transcript_48419:470-1249(-)